MMDENGRVWMTVQIRAGGKNYYPAWAKSTIATETNDPADVDIAYNLLAARGNNMMLGYYDTKTNKFVIGRYRIQHPSPADSIGKTGSGPMAAVPRRVNST